MNFKHLGLSDPLLKILEQKGFSEPTEIQEKSIPLVLEGKDIIAGSATGSGKTLAFGSGIVQNCEYKGKVQAIVLTPTRELALQVSKELRSYSKFKMFYITEVYGGVSIGPQIEKLRHTDVVVGTPGRILDHLSRGTLRLDNVKIVVLDEADRMLDMGFVDDVYQILDNCPDERQTLLYSATISSDIKSIAQNYMRDPVEISVESHVDPSKLKQVYYQVSQNMKFSLLVHLLKRESGLVMIFCNTQRFVDKVQRNLKKQGFDAVALHGGMSQSKRTKTIDKFHGAKAQILVCTDVAARGIHIDDVTHVYNYDIPNDPKQYVHRIGRTARAGKDGEAISLLCQRDYDNFNNVYHETRVEVERLETPEIENVGFHSFENRKQFGSRGRGRFAGNARSRGSFTTSRKRFTRRA